MENNNKYRDIAIDILNGLNNDYKWLYIKVKPIFRIHSIDKDNNFYVKPNDCRWWFGNSKKERYNKLSKLVKHGSKRNMFNILEYIVSLRCTFDLFIPEYPIPGYKFEKDIFNTGRYLLCYNGIITHKIIKPQVRDDYCPICYTDFSNNNFFITKCGHKFCGDCIFKHFQNNNGDKCPLCRTIFADKYTSNKNNRRRIIVDDDDDSWIHSTTAINDNDDWITELNNEITNTVETTHLSYVNISETEDDDISHNLYITPNVSFRYTTPTSEYLNNFLSPNNLLNEFNNSAYEVD